MKKILPLLLLAFGLHHFAQAQTICRADTVYSYKFIDGSTTKIPVGRTIYYPIANSNFDGDPYLEQEFKNNAYVNSSKFDVTLNSFGYYTEYSTAEWDSATSAWKVNYKESATYNANNQITENIRQELNQAGTLENVHKSNYTYNAAGRTTSSLRQNWINGAWRNAEQRTSTFQADTLETNLFVQFWDTTSSSWTNVEKTDKAYDASGNEITASYYQWDVNTSAWKGTASYARTYNQQKLLISSENMAWDLGTNTFVKSSKSIFAYNNAGLVIADTLQNWNTTLIAYVTGQVSAYTYNANNVRTSSRSTALNTTTGVPNWVTLNTITLDAADRELVNFSQDSGIVAGGAWTPNRRWTHTYNANGDRLSQLYEVRLSGDTMRNYNRVAWTYNTNSQVLTNVYENWDVTSSAWLTIYTTANEYNNDGFRTAYEYKNGWNATGNYFNNHTRNEYMCTLVSVGILDLVDVEVNIYPNPTNNLLNIQTDAVIEAVTIYNLQGQAVLHTKSNSQQLDLSSLSEGAYIMHLHTTEGATRKTIIKQ